MRKTFPVLLLMCLAALAAPAPVSATISSSISAIARGGSAGPANPPQNLISPEIIGLDYPNNGASVALSGVSTTLTANVGQWTNSPLSYTYCWHTVKAPCPAGSLGAGTTLTINTSTQPALVGQAIELDVIANNLAGSSPSKMSDWIGPIATTVPVSLPKLETCLVGSTWTPGTLITCGGVPNIDPSALPGPPTRHLQNGHAIANGCDIPPASPNTAAGHVWYVDPINGKTQAAGGTGVDLAHAWKDDGALFNSTPNYTSSPLFGFGRTIPPGDTIYIEPGNVANPAGNIVVPSGTYSTTNGTVGAAPVFTWIMTDPAAPSFAVIPANGSAGNAIQLSSSKGLIFKNLAVEPAVQNTLFQRGIYATSTSEAAPLYDILFENMRISSWVGHSQDPLPGTYPMQGGTADGTVVTAAAALGPNSGQNITQIALTGSMAIGASSISNITSLPPDIGWFVWSPGYFGSATSSGIPNGTIVKNINGLTSFHNSGSVTAFHTSDIPALAGLTNNGTVTSVGAMTGTCTTCYWILATTATANQVVYTYNSTAWVATSNTLVPQSSTITNALYTATVNNHIIAWDATLGTPAWVDKGVLNIQLGPCDPINDVGKGCPSNPYQDPVTHQLLSGPGSNVPQCDPKINLQGAPIGGCSGTITPWVGTQRVINSGEQLVFTDYMVIPPAGAYTQSDWMGVFLTGVNFQGNVDIPGSTDSLYPAKLVGVHCISLKDNWIRDVSNGVGFSQMTDSVAYKNFIRYFTVDGFDRYTNHRILLINNRITEPTQPANHVDFIQIGIISGAELRYEYDNAIVGNELLQNTDATNFFPTSGQGLSETNHWQLRAYWANNVLKQRGNNTFYGRYSVITNNDFLSYFLSMTRDNHEQPPATRNNISSMGLLVANNIANGLSRDATITNWCSVDLSTWYSNLSIPFWPFAAGSLFSQFCDLVNNQTSSGQPGMYNGLNQWTTTAWDSSVAPTGSLFTDFSALPLPSLGQPGYNLMSFPSVTPYVNLSLFPFDNATGGLGAINARPNVSFAGTPNATAQAVVCNTRYASAGNTPTLPTGLADGTNYVAFESACSPTAQTSPCGQGIWESCGLGSVTCTGTVRTTSTGAPNTCNGAANFSTSGSKWMQLSTTVNPGLIGAGTDLGAQMPIADHNGDPWASPLPSIGAYE